VTVLACLCVFSLWFRRLCSAVRVGQGVSDLMAWLCPDAEQEQPELLPELVPTLPELVLLDNAAPLDLEDASLIKAVFSNCRSVILQPLSGGFSGSKVFCARSKNLRNESEFPTLVKTGPRESVARERLRAHLVERMIGGNAPRVLAFFDGAKRAVLCSSFAALVSGPEEVPIVFWGCFFFFLFFVLVCFLRCLRL
jgi:hypothetical protein